MSKIISSALALDQGEALLFSDLENNGEMWTGRGDRSRVTNVRFKEAFRNPPQVNIAIKMIDISEGANQRYDLILEDVSPKGFDVRLKTWSDTKIARASINWSAIGTAFDENDWDDIDAV